MYLKSLFTYYEVCIYEIVALAAYAVLLLFLLFSVDILQFCHKTTFIFQIEILTVWLFVSCPRPMFNQNFQSQINKQQNGQ